MSNICGKIGDVCANTSWEIWGSTQIFAKNPYLQEKQFKGKNLWKSGFKLAFNRKTQFVGRITLKQICPKLFPALLSLFFSFWVHARFCFTKSPSRICYTLATDPQIFIALFSLSPSNSVFLVLVLHSLLCLFNSLWIPSPVFHLGIITHSEPNLLHDSVFVEAPPLKCKAAEEAANCTLLLQYHLCLGHLFHTRELMDSIALRV